MSDTNLGRFRINPRGEIKPNEQYKFLDLVTYNGSAYLNINNELIDGTASTGQLPTELESSTEYYMLLVSKGDKGDMADKYDPFLLLTDNIWDYAITDKVRLSSLYDESKLLQINNVYDGCCGMIVTDKDIALPFNSCTSEDYHYLIALNEQYYVYTFVYNEEIDRFIWNRSVYKDE